MDEEEDNLPGPSGDRTPDDGMPSGRANHFTVSPLVITYEARTVETLLYIHNTHHETYSKQPIPLYSKWLLVSEQQN